MDLTKRIVIEGPLIVAQNVDYTDHPQLGPLLTEGWQVQSITRTFGHDPVVELTKVVEPLENSK